jgi:DNA-binding MurR/RpiR family transcriptional regulator
MTPDNQFKQELHVLEAELKAAYEEFKKAYRETYDNEELTDSDVYKKVIDEDLVFNNHLDEIKKRTIDIMSKIHQQHDQKALEEVLGRLHNQNTHVRPN